MLRRQTRSDLLETMLKHSCSAFALDRAIIEDPAVVGHLVRDAQGLMARGVRGFIDEHHAYGQGWAIPGQDPASVWTLAYSGALITGGGRRSPGPPRTPGSVCPICASSRSRAPACWPPIPTLTRSSPCWPDRDTPKRVTAGAAPVIHWLAGGCRRDRRGRSRRHEERHVKALLGTGQPGVAAHQKILLHKVALPHDGSRRINDRDMHRAVNTEISGRWPTATKTENSPQPIAASRHLDQDIATVTKLLGRMPHLAVERALCSAGDRFDLASECNVAVPEDDVGAGAAWPRDLRREAWKVAQCADGVDTGEGERRVAVGDQGRDLESLLRC